eukprot:TRINITY_DN13828_c0_g1_i2.p1 TRINITY_DN13828_c0_g1~~TRINITY_DN13828_c0_g1_i2.p1  ORF type:complete len:205 (+),score=71.03 TRINITY_DN13828_c0_g1_i2:2-616(+)
MRKLPEVDDEGLKVPIHWGTMTQDLDGVMVRQREADTRIDSEDTAAPEGARQKQWEAGEFSDYVRDLRLLFSNQRALLDQICNNVISLEEDTEPDVDVSEYLMNEGISLNDPEMDQEVQEALDSARSMSSVASSGISFPSQATDRTEGRAHLDWDNESRDYPPSSSDYSHNDQYHDQEQEEEEEEEEEDYLLEEDEAEDVHEQM